ncbi:hypothetical protein E2P81_ATG00364 [Venturia nashicola]|nr:hypothetical protein E2P81_ATG00364 [Venturia nashicola]
MHPVFGAVNFMIPNITTLKINTHNNPPTCDIALSTSKQIDTQSLPATHQKHKPATVSLALSSLIKYKSRPHLAIIVSTEFDDHKEQEIKYHHIALRNFSHRGRNDESIQDFDLLLSPSMYIPPQRLQQWWG